MLALKKQSHGRNFLYCKSSFWGVFQAACAGSHHQLPLMSASIKNGAIWCSPPPDGTTSKNAGGQFYMCLLLGDSSPCLPVHLIALANRFICACWLVVVQDGYNCKLQKFSLSSSSQHFVPFSRFFKHAYYTSSYFVLARLITKYSRVCGISALPFLPYTKGEGISKAHLLQAFTPVKYTSYSSLYAPSTGKFSNADHLAGAQVKESTKHSLAASFNFVASPSQNYAKDRQSAIGNRRLVGRMPFGFVNKYSSLWSPNGRRTAVFNKIEKVTQRGAPLFAYQDQSSHSSGFGGSEMIGDKDPGCRTIVITSGKGGVGKTTTTANLGMSIARLGYRVALIDADIGLRNLDLLLGLENRVLYTAMDIFEGECRLDQALIRDKRLKNLCLLAISKNRQRYNVTRQNMDSLVSSIAALGYNFILIDCPAGIDVGFINAISPAQEALIVTTPEITAMRDADRVAGLLEANGVYNAKLLINRVRPDMIQRHDMMSVQDVQDVLGIPLLGAIPEDLHVIISTNRGEPLVLRKKLTLSGIAFENAARRLIGKQDYLIDLKTPYKGIFQKIQTFFFNNDNEIMKM